MSFIDDILDVGGSLWKNLTGSGVAGGIAKAAALGYLLKEVTESINKDNQKSDTTSSSVPDPGVREQVNPDTQHSVPVVYGSAYLGGIVTDAELVNSNQTMWYCITVCEKTGPLINGTPSVISFDDIYWDEQRVTLGSDGITLSKLTDEDGVETTDLAGLVKFYFYSGGSTYPVSPKNYTVASPQAAYAVWAGGGKWTADHTMDDLVFCLIRVDYNKDAGSTGIGTVTFKMTNTMTQPGDCLYDYMTNTRYGAGIDPTEIYSE